MTAKEAGGAVQQQQEPPDLVYDSDVNAAAVAPPPAQLSPILAANQLSPIQLNDILGAF